MPAAPRPTGEPRASNCVPECTVRGRCRSWSLAFVLVLVPVLLVAIPDVHAAEVVLAALIAGFPVFVFVLVGALAGSMLSDLREP